MPDTWTNWSGSVTCSPARIERPRDESELATIVATHAGPVRVAGSGHSFTPICETTGTLLSLDALSGIVEADAVAGTATVWAGTKLYDLGEPLLQAGLGLANMGDIDRQALAGAVSTGTHGTGRTLGSFSSQVAGLRIVTAGGDLLDCSETVEPEVFHAARVSLGAFGVLSRITLRVLPAYRLHERTWPAPFEPCMAQLPELIEQNRHFELFWSPHDDACAMKALNPTDRPVGEIAPPIPASGRMPRYLTPERVDWSHRIFPSERNLKFNEMEFAVPAESGPDCLREIRELMRTRHPDVFWPIEYRTLRADDIPLSPASGRATVTISIHQAVELPREAFFSDAEAIFRNHRGRPHWGKLHTHTARELRALYPEFDRFRAARERADPTGRFLNAHLRTLFET
ncbi:MAG: D-arabinono-1,4-lactone oxidase [Chloroflexota bacterium]